MITTQSNFLNHTLQEITRVITVPAQALSQALSSNVGALPDRCPCCNYKTLKVGESEDFITCSKCQSVFKNVLYRTGTNRLYINGHARFMSSYKMCSTSICKHAWPRLGILNPELRQFCGNKSNCSISSRVWLCPKCNKFSVVSKKCVICGTENQCSVGSKYITNLCEHLNIETPGASLVIEKYSLNKQVSEQKQTSLPLVVKKEPVIVFETGKCR